ncbi:MAG: OmpH family outer membrane protein [Bacteroidaceae bacterium]
MKMNKITLGVVCMAIFSTLGSCSKNAENVTEETANAEQTVGLKIAYVELDTLMSQYQLYKDYSEVLTRKGNNIQVTLTQKQRTLESHAAALQKKYESNGFTTRDELERAQASIQREQEDLQELAARLNNEFNEEQARINEEARDSIQTFLKQFNRTRKYDYVMIKAGENLLIANPKFDITKDVVKGLNKRYRIRPEVAEQIKKVDTKEDSSAK